MTASKIASEPSQKPKSGRKPGCEKTGGAGFYKPPRHLSPRQAREWLWNHGGDQVLENRLRRALGMSVSATGPTGKSYWRATSETEQARAEEWVVNRLVPAINAVSILGEAGADPVRLEGAGHDGDKELARRVALLMLKADSATGDTGGRQGNGVALAPPSPAKISENSEVQKINGRSAPKISEEKNEVRPDLIIGERRFRPNVYTRRSQLPCCTRRGG